MAAPVLLHPAARAPAVLGDVARGRVGDAVPACDPDAVRQGELAGAVAAGVVEHLDARARAGVEAGDVAELLDAGHPRAGERQGGLAAAGVAEVEGLEVVPEGGAGADAQRRGVRGVLVGLDDTLRTGGGVAAGGPGVDLEVVGVAGEPVEAGGLRAQRDREEPPPARHLRRDPGGREVGLGAAGARVPGDVDPDGAEGGVLDPGVHRGLGRRDALVEAVAGEVTRRRGGDPGGRPGAGGRGGRVGHGRRRGREQRAGEGDGKGDEDAGTATHGDSHDSVTGRPGGDGTPP